MGDSLHQETRDGSSPGSPAPAGAATWAARLGLAAWMPVVLAGVATLNLGHWIPLPHPDGGDAVLAGSVTALHGAEAADTWSMTHVLYEGCRCSGRIVEHLLDSKRPTGASETLLIVGTRGEYADRAARSGFRVEEISQSELESRYGIGCAPLLVVARPGGELGYVGGYTARKQGLAVSDLSILEALRSGEAVEPLPVYGCGVSDTLRASLDPLGLFE